MLWHGWVACAVYLLALAIRPRILAAAAAAGLFLLHPAHVEVVAWISSRKDLVATGFAALSMAAYLLYRRRSRRWGWWYAGSVLAFLLASAGKQSVLLLPAIMLVWDLLVERRWNWQMVADKLPFGLITLFFGWMTWHAQPSTNQALNPFVLASTQFTNLWLLTGLGQYVLYRPAPNPANWSQAARLALIIAAVLVWVLPLLFVWGRKPVQPAPRDEPATAPPGSSDLDCGGRAQRRHRFSGLGALARAAWRFASRRSPEGVAATSATLCYWVLIQMVPPMLLAFIVPITDRYLFLPSVGVCLLLAVLIAELEKRLRGMAWFPWTLLAILGLVWGIKTWSYIGEWRDPRSVWYGAHLKTSNSQVQQFLAEVYQNAGDRINGFIKSGTGLQLTNELVFARAVLSDEAAVERLRAEWSGTVPARTNSVAYRDQLWAFAWQRFEESVARRGTLNAPNLFMGRGRLLVSEGKFAQAIPEFQNALALAQTSNYAAIRNEGVTHALFAIGVAYWNMGNYAEAEKWLLKAQAAQRKSGQVWLPALDQEVERIKRIAGGSTGGVTLLSKAQRLE